MKTELTIGLDIGSTTVKAVVIDTNEAIIWSDYQRHESKQVQKVTELLGAIQSDLKEDRFGIAMTGSGASSLADDLGACFVQEVNALARAVETRHPHASSVIELGGQDAKIILFKRDKYGGSQQKIFSMNDKCAGGTGAVIDKIASKLKIGPSELSALPYNGVETHAVAGKCGVFAETDINSLQKTGIPAEQLMASLFDAIVLQNLTVLTRGNTLLPEVLLLGGPNAFIPGLVEAWRHHLTLLWRQRNMFFAAKDTPDTLIKVPEHALYFAALGAALFCKRERTGVYIGLKQFQQSIAEQRKCAVSADSVSNGLWRTEQELKTFLQAYKPEAFLPKECPAGRLEGFIGLDGGSTTTKAVLLDHSGEVLAKSYQLSQGNPIEDSKQVLRSLHDQLRTSETELHILGLGVTGYAKDILKDALGADTAIVETVAHAESALQFYPDVDVICDVGGQDIKLIFLHDGRVKDFKLNTQCSAGNGYFLQSTAKDFGFTVEQFAERAFSAKAMPEFGYGCAVFLQSDIVNFQRQGWRQEQIMAGLAAVLPKNIWLYVGQIPNLATLGNTFLLQGGTQKNLAAVKAQVDYIRSFFNDEHTANVRVHRHCGEAGAIGAAIEAKRHFLSGKVSTFIGFEALEWLSYKTHHDESTRCEFCRNRCMRTFIDVKTRQLVGEITEPALNDSVSLATKRIIVGANCDRGTVESVEAVKTIKHKQQQFNVDYPNLANIAAVQVWKPCKPAHVADPLSRFNKRRAERMLVRSRLRIGIPRVLNNFSVNPLFSAYFESLGIVSSNLVYSDFTSEKLYQEGAKRGSIDPCFPSKVCIAHVHNLLYGQRQPVDVIFFPMIEQLPSTLVGTEGCYACPTITATPEAVKAAFTKEQNLFEKMGVLYLNPILDLSYPALLERQLFAAFHRLLGLSKSENRRAMKQGLKALQQFRQSMQIKALAMLETLEREQGLGIVLLGRPYHNDPGINHGILDMLQALGYPIFTQDTLPMDEQHLMQLFGEEIRDGLLNDPKEISDVWKNAYSENTNQKLWAAKYTARHPNLVGLELSSFKCGHDAPIYSTIERILEYSGTPYFSFKDIDENKAVNSIKIRIETMDYFLKRYRTEKLLKQRC